MVDQVPAKPLKPWVAAAAAPVELAETVVVKEAAMAEPGSQAASRACR
jgi:hypothetical protein